MIRAKGKDKREVIADTLNKVPSKENRLLFLGM